jgi:hypothetical protein
MYRSTKIKLWMTIDILLLIFFCGMSSKYWQTDPNLAYIFAVLFGIGTAVYACLIYKLGIVQDMWSTVRDFSSFLKEERERKKSSKK